MSRPSPPPGDAGRRVAGAAVLFDELTWPRIARLVADGESLCLLPVGATE
jgi:hypothetical protein